MIEWILAHPPQTGNTVDYSNVSKGIYANLEQKVGYTPDLNRTLRIMPLGDSITRRTSSTIRQRVS